MNLELSSEQRELTSLARQLLADLSPLTLARSFLDGDGDHSALWSQLRDLGWYGVGLGDDPFGVSGLACLARAAGEHAAPTPLVDTAVAVRLARRLGIAPAADSALTSLAAGEATVALALVEPGADWQRSHLGESIRRKDGEGMVSTTKWNVTHAGSVDIHLVVGRCEGCDAVAFVPADAHGIHSAAEGGMDPTAQFTTVTFDDVRVSDDRVFPEVSADLLDDALGLGAVLSAAEAVGAASAALDMAIEYSHDRTQFGRAIGSFQALQQLMAGAHVLREAAWSTTLYAAAAIEEGLPDRQHAIHVAKVYASEAAQDVVEAAIQVLGGIAFTWEHDVHLLQRRVLAANQRYGNARHYRDRLGDEVARVMREAAA